MSRSSAAVSERGVSLLETLVALAVFALALGQVAVSVGGSERTAATAASDISAVIAAAGRRAQMDGEPRVLRLADAQLTIWRLGQIEQAYLPPDGLVLQVFQPVRLFADGGTTGGGIQLADAHQTYVLKISRFDGSTTTERRANAQR